jgi:hypothetical protein
MPPEQPSDRPMTLLRRAALAWIPLAVLATCLAGVVYVVAQQLVRTGADEPQLQLATADAAALDRGATPASLAAGQPVDARDALAPFVIVTDARGAVLATDATLDGKPPVPPAGILEAARGGAVDRVTWQPANGVRLAQVTQGWRGGAVTVARSLRETERVEDLLLGLVGAGLLGTLAALGVVCTAIVWGTGRRSPTTHP